MDVSNILREEERELLNKKPLTLASFRTLSGEIRTAKLTEDIVRGYLQRKKNGEAPALLVKEMVYKEQISKSQASAIIHRKSWRHVEV